MKKLNKIVATTLALVVFSACNDYTPKPKAYPRVIYPDKEYKTSNIDCPFDMEVPVYTQFVQANPNEECWYNLNFKPFNATLHLSYKPILKPSDLDSLAEDAYKLAFKHISKAEEIIPREIGDSVNYGLIYDLEGKTATPINFFYTDQKQHFIRGSFYFNEKTNRDSVAPIYDFIRKDIIHGIKSLEWKY